MSSKRCPGSEYLAENKPLVKVAHVIDSLKYSLSLRTLAIFLPFLVADLIADPLFSQSTTSSLSPYHFLNLPPLLYGNHLRLLSNADSLLSQYSPTFIFETSLHDLKNRSLSPVVIPALASPITFIDGNDSNALSNSSVDQYAIGDPGIRSNDSTPLINK